MKLSHQLEENAPLILAGLAIGGFIASAVMSARAAPKAQEELDELPEDATYYEKGRAIASLYAPTVGMLMLSTACIVASNRMYRQRYVTLLALYSIGEKTLQKWQESVLEVVGPKKAEAVRERTVYPDAPMPTNLILNDDKVMFFDVLNGRYFYSDSIETVRQAVNDLNERMLSEDFMAVNELYYYLSLPPIELGDDIGWRIDDGSIKIVLDAFIKDDKPCVSMSFVTKPKWY